jgi:hypothetical protein
MTDGSPQVSGRVALDNHDIQVQAGHLNLADHLTCCEEVGLVGEARWLEFLHLQGLISVRIGENEDCVTQGEKAEDEKKVGRAAEDAGSR